MLLPQSSVTSDERQSLLRPSYTESVSFQTDTDGSSTLTFGPAQSALRNLISIFTEVIVLAEASIPLIFAYLLQHSLTILTVAVAGHLGPLDIAACSLAIVTSNLTGIGIYEGLAAGLDHLCARAYEAGRPSLVGVYVQHMIHLMLMCTIPIALMWAYSPYWLGLLVSEQVLADRAGMVMVVLAIGNPGYTLFEAGRRFVQAQGLFRAPLYVMMLALPTNVILIWLLTYKLRLGLIGAALALAVTRTLFPIYLLAYVLVVKPSSLQCWGGWESFQPKVWGHMIWLSLPDVCVFEAELLIFFYLTVAATYVSVDAAAAQSVMTTIAVILVQIPVATGIAIGTRLGYLVGLEALHQARLTIKISIWLSLCLGGLSALLLYAFTEPILGLLSADEHVKQLVREALPIFVVFQIPGHATVVTNGMLRGIARHGRGAGINFLLFVAIGVPAGLSFCFGPPQMQISGLWLGAIVRHTLVATICAAYLLMADLGEVAAKFKEIE